jgi:aryl-alcohol dehydrogenase-like predicted oxidoreductase
VSVQNRYSIADRGSEDVLEYCEQEKLGFIPWFPLAPVVFPVLTALSIV